MDLIHGAMHSVISSKKFSYLMKATYWEQLHKGSASFEKKNYTHEIMKEKQLYVW